MQTNYKPTHNLDVLRILYIVKACFNFLGMLFFLVYAFMGSFFNALIENFPADQNQEEFPEQIFWIFGIIGGIGAFVCLILGIVTLIAAARINSRTSYTFIFVVGIINCFTGMLGIGLGVFTIIELTKPHVKALFQPATDSKIGF